MSEKGKVLEFGAELEKHWLVPEAFGNTRSLITLELAKHASLGLTDDEARKLTPETAEFVKTIERDPNFSYHIMIPIGIGELWGINFRGDLVYRNEMIPDVRSAEYARRAYGYPTFGTAHFFAHHRNKPHLGHPVLGDVPFNTLNHKMGWVELVTRVHLPSVEEHESSLLSGIIKGQFPISMGLLAIADVCLKCSNVRNSPSSKACKHITPPKKGGELGRIYGDGSVAGMSNIRPRFFDVSDVSEGADSIGWSVKKVAEANPSQRSDHELIVIRDSLNTMKQTGLLDKIKSVPKTKSKELEKLSKVKQALQALAREEPDIDPAVLQKQASIHGTSLLDAMAMAGLMLRPHEFQSAYLGATNPTLGQQLTTQQRTFPMTSTDFPDFATAMGQPFQIAPNGVRMWVGQNLAPWKSWDAQMLLHRMLAPQPVITPMVTPQVWTPSVSDSGLKTQYLQYLARAISSVIEKAAGYTGPPGFDMETDPDALEVSKEASLGPLAMVLPAMYFAHLLGSDVMSGNIPGVGAAIPVTGIPQERSPLQKLIMFNPMIGTSFMGVADKAGKAILNRIDDILLRRLVKA